MFPKLCSIPQDIFFMICPNIITINTYWVPNICEPLQADWYPISYPDWMEKQRHREVKLPVQRGPTAIKLWSQWPNSGHWVPELFLGYYDPSHLFSFPSTIQNYFPFPEPRPFMWLCSAHAVLSLGMVSSTGHNHPMSYTCLPLDPNI